MTNTNQLKKQLNLWNRLKKQFSKLNDNNFTARKLFEYIVKYYKP